ncbi:hypothetical protein EDB80DRAFT_175630 [Ilyonectria destructans]|nr:hypothetical protein EDB80DRAFT_238915 [Ilyonectria destructans]KAH6988760.1 hypothetical protein EDB80DRAFT_175630 [Ilyonectria destructans]
MGCRRWCTIGWNGMSQRHGKKTRTAQVVPPTERGMDDEGSLDVEKLLFACNAVNGDAAAGGAKAGPTTRVESAERRPGLADGCEPYIHVSRGDEFADSFDASFFAKTFLQPMSRESHLSMSSPRCCMALARTWTRPGPGGHCALEAERSATLDISSLLDNREQFSAAFDEEANFCAGATQIHTHSPTCVKYSLCKGKGRAKKRGLCRFQAPWRLVEKDSLHGRRRVAGPKEAYHGESVEQGHGRGASPQP